ncbi:MAG: hypothetical protein ACXWB2_22360 [Acidimicrobiales bacterium]
MTDGWQHAGRYARVEIERRWILSEPPDPTAAVAVRHLTDRYLTGTRLRLRLQVEQGGPTQRKLTQKLPDPEPRTRGRQGLLTNTYLSQDEYDVLATLPAVELRKTRYSVAPFGVDVFAGPLTGLVLAEIEHPTEDAADRSPVPSTAVVEVTHDARFTGGRLVRTGPEELRAWLRELGVPFVPSPDSP